MTEKLYEHDSYIKEFSATVLSSVHDGKVYKTVLDRTAFFPEGGGQYGDTGHIGEARVLDTQINFGIIVHFTDREVSGNVDCEIDFKKRYMRMQNHTGEHIFSGLAHSRFGYNNVGFHLSDEEVTLDLDGKLTSGDISMLEAECNSVIDRNLSVNIIYPTAQELPSLDYRSKLELSENVRIAVIYGVDICACCAPHVNRTGEVGLLKVMKFYNYKGGTRIHLLCGALARADYMRISDINTEIAVANSVGRYELSLLDRRKNEEIYQLKLRIKELNKKIVLSILNSTQPGNDLYLYFLNDMDSKDAMRICDISMTKYTNSMSAVFTGDDTIGYSFCIGGKKSDEIFSIFMQRFMAKGGGKDVFQGRVSATENEIREFFDTEMIKKHTL